MSSALTCGSDCGRSATVTVTCGSELVRKVAACALWLRVSTDRQDEANQLPALQQFAQHRGWTVRYTYRLNDVSASKGKHKEVMAQALDDAWRGEFSYIVVWALDRICREGAEDALKTIRMFRERGCTLMSVQEPWLNTTSEITDVLVSFAGWVAQQESRRHAERIKAGLERRRAKGLPVGGRQAGAKDRKPRKRRSTSG